MIGVSGGIPWHYSADMKRFKRLTVGTTVIMGRLTWESLPVKPLPDRRNVVVTRSALPGVDCYRDLESALASCTTEDVWFIGGARIFEEAMRHADRIDLTYVPDAIEADDAVYFPDIDPAEWTAGPLERDPEDERLERRIFRRKEKGER